MSHGKIYGHVGDIRPGATFDDRADLLRSGVHGQLQAGISGDSNEDGGAYSICISGGYEDNRDMGDKIIYVGSGGQDRNDTQLADQSFDHFPNKALLISSQTKRPVRVIRGKSAKNFYSPKTGFRYDGLYVVDKAEMKVGKKGYRMCFFELRRIRENDGYEIPTRRLLDTKKLNRMRRGVLKIK